MIVRVGPDAAEVVAAVVEVVEVHVTQDPAGEGGVDVRVLDARHDRRAADELATGTDTFADVGLGPDRHDAVTLHRDGVGVGRRAPGR